MNLSNAKSKFLNFGRSRNSYECSSTLYKVEMMGRHWSRPQGIEPENSNSLNWSIYLHGTNQESLIGRPVSHGCIRFTNKDIIEIFDLLATGSEVEVV